MSNLNMTITTLLTIIHEILIACPYAFFQSLHHGIKHEVETPGKSAAAA